MKLFVSLLVLSVYLLSLVKCDDLQVGSPIGSQLIYVENVQLNAIPFTKRTKNVFFNDQDNMRSIRGITVADLDRSNATASITSGGIGYTYVNVRIKSERGEGLNYQVQIFA